MEVLDPGHVYLLNHIGKGMQLLYFLKRSGDAIQYDMEWDGPLSQEVLRALIDRTKYLDSVLPCNETKDALWHLRMALYLYEVRAWRRKQENINRKKPAHKDDIRPRPWREYPHEVPFNEQDIELRLVGLDGHILLKEAV